MLTRNQIKEWRSLGSKKYRRQLQKYIAEGEKIVGEILELMPSDLLYVICTDAYHKSLSSKTIAALGNRVMPCDQSTLDGISALNTPSPVMAIMKLPSMANCTTVADGLSLYLDGIRDPGNLGTILRIADWFGVDVYLSDDCVDVYNPKSIQASMGAFLRVRVNVASLSELQSVNPTLHILGTAIDQGEDALRFAWPKCSLLVIGSESHGIRESNTNIIQRWLSIPRGSNVSGSESLNAAVAAGILCSSHLTFHRSQGFV